jgi:uncharacterized membrane protein
MPGSKDHIRKTFLTGIFAAAPLGITVFLIYWVNDKTEVVTQFLFHRNIPFLGVVMALGLIYLIGMMANSLLGKFFLRRLDAVLSHVPMVRQLYRGWKQIALTPGGTEGTFSKVVLIPDESGRMRWLAFTSGRLLEGAEPMYCVFVPGAPNPISGRLYFVPVDQCTILNMSVEEAFKLILSTGNYVPPLVAAATIVDASGQPA